MGRWIAFVMLGACGTAENGSDADLVWNGEAGQIVLDRCASCHQPGDIAPFSLTNYEEAAQYATAIKASVESGSMPPWQASDDCNDFQGNFDLTPDEAATLIAWVDAGAPEGDPANAPVWSQDAGDDWNADLTLQLPEPFTPTHEPDDYRCQLIPWPEEDTVYVTGLRVQPDQRAIVHHTIAFLIGPDQVAQFEAYDDAEEGPGYTCYGGPRPGTGEATGGLLGDVDPATLLGALGDLGLTLADVREGNLSPQQMAQLLGTLTGSEDSRPNLGFAQIGNWVPGVPSKLLPQGTGIKVVPGSMLVVQMHYNTLTASPVADQSVIEIALTDEVEREAVNMQLVDLGWVSQGLIGEPMTIPAGAADVTHSTELTFDGIFAMQARATLGLPADAPLVLHQAGHHMHQLGTRITSELIQDDGTSTCLLDLPDWDFNWQGAYRFSSPITLREGDRIKLTCTWDNSAENQPFIDGEAKQPEDIAWGEGTSDEMCLGGYYVTGE